MIFKAILQALRDGEGDYNLLLLQSIYRLFY